MNTKNAVKARPMPEIFLLDPITGELPKNYKEILANRYGKKKKSDNFPGGESSNTRNPPKIRAVRMPELEFLDPVTGEFPKNVQELIMKKKKKELQVSELCSTNDSYVNIQQISKYRENTKRRSKNLEFKVSTLDVKRMSLPDSAGQTNNYNKAKGVRKALFTNKENRLSREIKKTESTVVNETMPLLDIEETEQQILLPKKKLKSISHLTLPNRNAEKTSNPLKNLSVRSSPLGDLKQTASLSESPVLSSSSLEEFIKLEQQLKTPKGLNKRNIDKGSSILKKINNIKIKLNENDRLTKTIEANTAEVRSNLDELIRYLNIPDSELESDNNSTENMYNKSAKLMKETSAKNNLRVATMQKNLKRKVLFELNEKENSDSDIMIKKSKSIQKSSLVQTPNTMFRLTKQKAREQYMKLQGTPKAKH